MSRDDDRLTNHDAARMPEHDVAVEDFSPFPGVDGEEMRRYRESHLPPPGRQAVILDAERDFVAIVDAEQAPRLVKLINWALANYPYVIKEDGGE